MRLRFQKIGKHTAMNITMFFFSVSEQGNRGAASDSDDAVGTQLGLLSWEHARCKAMYVSSKGVNRVSTVKTSYAPRD
jgi:hypothetical protein